jgi:hypothetical protein
VENTNAHLSYHKQNYQNLHDTHLDQEDVPSTNAYKMGFQNYQWIRDHFYHDRYGSSSLSTHGLILQYISACLISLVLDHLF